MLGIREGVGLCAGRLDGIDDGADRLAVVYVGDPIVPSEGCQKRFGFK